MRNFLKVDDLTGDELTAVLDRADELKELWDTNAMPQSLKGKRAALWFYGQGFRNRVAFELGARALGADVSFIPGELGVHEPIEDIGAYLDNWFDFFAIRCKNHGDLETVAAQTRGPVINARTSFNHPCEIVGDLQYIRRERKTLEGLSVVFVGELTNLCMSWFEAARALPISVTQVGPAEYLASPAELERLNDGAAGSVKVSPDLSGSVSRETDVLYTDCWPKGGDAGKTRDAFLPYQVTKDLVLRMNGAGFFLPCPPITRGEEIAADSLDTAQYRDYGAKEYLLHAQNAIMERCMGRLD